MFTRSEILSNAFRTDCTDGYKTRSVKYSKLKYFLLKLVLILALMKFEIGAGIHASTQ